MTETREPKRLQRRRTKGYRMPQGAVYVGRGSRWGNPFRVGDPVPDPWTEFSWTGSIVRDSAEAVRLFNLYVQATVGLTTLAQMYLRGKDLACWCALDQPCHADVWLRFSNMGGEDA